MSLRALQGAMFRHQHSNMDQFSPY